MALPARILVRSPNWIGDHVMALGFYEGLRRAYPEAHLSLLCSENVSGLDFPDLFQSKIVLRREDRRVPISIVRFARRLAREHFDLGISLPASLSSAFLLFVAGIPNRVGFSGDGGQLFLTASRPWKGREAGKHKSVQYLELLEWMTGKTVTPALGKEENPTREELILLAPGASIALREWPYFDELIPALRAGFPGYRIGVLGASAESRWHSILKGAGDSGVEDWVERTTLPELVSLCRRARLVIANDSGVAHLAATLAGASTLVLFGPGDPDYIRPSGARVFDARVSDLACSPCEKAICRAPYGYQECLRRLSVDVVLSKAREILL